MRQLNFLDDERTLGADALQLLETLRLRSVRYNGVGKILDDFVLQMLKLTQHRNQVDVLWGEFC